MTGRKPDSFIILIPGFPADEAEDNCLPFQQCFVKYFRKACPGLTIRVLSFQYPFRSAEYNWHNCLITSFGGRNRAGIHKWLLRKRILRYLGKVYKQENIKGILSFWLGECAWVGKQFANSHGLMHKCWLMGQDAKPGNKYVPELSMAMEELICLSDTLQQEFEKNYGGHPAHVIYPAVDTDLYNPHINFKDIDLIAAGSLIPLKRFDVLIRLVKKLVATLPSLRVVISGKGPQEQELKALVKESGLQKTVSFTGQVAHYELLQLMQRSRILIHPSGYEGFSGVCMEALYAGCRVVSFTRPLHKEISNWHVVHNETEMETLVQQLLKEKELTEKSLINTIDKTMQSVKCLFGL